MWSNRASPDKHGLQDSYADDGYHMPSFSSTQSIQESHLSDLQHSSRPIYKFEPVDSYVHDHQSNQTTSTPNQSVDSHGKYSIPPNNDVHRSKSSTPTTHSTIDHLNARAAELKAQLLQKKKDGRSNSDTLSILTTKIDKNEQGNAGNSSSQDASPAPQIIEHKEPELNISELISQYAKQKYAEENGTANTKIDQQKMLENIHARAKKLNEAAAQARASTQSPNTSITNNVNNNFDSNARENMNNDIRTAISNTLVDEVSKDSPSKILPNSRPPSKPQGSAQGSKVPKEPAAMASKLSPHTETSYSTQTSAKHNSITSKTLKRQPKLCANTDGKLPTPQEHSNSNQETNNREMTESRSQNYSKSTEQNSPSLEQLLPFNDDLREWLEITGFHNIAYRDKILSRRRAIAALDAQREKLLAEMEAEERGVVPVIGGTGQAKSSIPPPPIIPRQHESSPATPLTPGTQASTTDPRAKRPYSELQSEADIADNKIKAARIESRNESRRVGEPNPVPSGISVSESKPMELSHKRSDDGKYSSHHERYDDSHDRKRGTSPDLKTFENRGIAHSRKTSGDYDYDRDERPAKAPFVVRGNYRGRSYDPFYHSRGRRRSISDRGPIERPARVSQYGIPLAFRDPYINLRGYNRGGKGDVRYFIVKSFNEANVANCIEDSVWTTQIQNGEIFKHAFETCKNVILVFSINKSRAFQGYARMESIPGSVPNPSWTKSIHWEDAGSFRVRWLVVYSTRFNLVGHLKNSLNESQAVLVGKDGQEIEEKCGDELIRIIDEEAERAL